MTYAEAKRLADTEWSRAAWRALALGLLVLYGAAVWRNYELADSSATRLCAKLQAEGWTP